MAIRVLLLGAHPDDAEFFAGGLLWNHSRQGSVIRMISVTDGRCGHHSMESDALVQRRRSEASESAKLLNAEYHTWDFPDGSLLPTLEVRHRIISEIRSFSPDLVLTHRTCDYHPDHRAVGQAVQDASYLVTVPKIVPEQPALRRDPIVAYMADTFSRPTPFKPDFVLDASKAVDAIVSNLACHESQVFEWLPYNQGILDQVPMDLAARIVWLKRWFLEMTNQRSHLFWQGDTVPELVEAYEVSEYAGRLSEADAQTLFPGCLRVQS